jgi:hypothetical protein
MTTLVHAKPSPCGLGFSPSLRSLGEMITAASTCYDENMQNYLQQHVHLVKEDRGPDHWLSELPASLRIVIEKASSID